MAIAAANASQSWTEKPEYKFLARGFGFYTEWQECLSREGYLENADKIAVAWGSMASVATLQNWSACEGDKAEKDSKKGVECRRVATSFVYHLAKNYRIESVAQVMRELPETGSLDKAFQKVYGKTQAQIEGEWHKSLSSVQH